MIRGLDKLRARNCRSSDRYQRDPGRHRYTKMHTNRTSRRQAFTLMEVMICLVIVMMAGVATVGAITYTRLNMEMEKQRLAALNYCRKYMEAIQSLDTAYADTVMLVPFNAPGITDLNANIKIEYFKLNGVNEEDASPGTVDWSSPMTGPSLDEPVYARVTVSWTPYGSQARPQEVSMSTIVTRGID